MLQGIDYSQEWHGHNPPALPSRDSSAEARKAVSSLCGDVGGERKQAIHQLFSRLDSRSVPCSLTCANALFAAKKRG